ncbi:hypothetical protein FN976_22380 [Caenimonas sedimenti]|uniref:histidine kinase n=1 Tax=Caenimonas sedimenti TaxID=2596921 RepID=A0A562ZJI1_9BURK|nr:hypothetical protein [Caenimonas sedimenti]TWO68740.1 hypothetical protein FN976_22380 [Caenimonas sedimenti]
MRFLRALLTILALCWAQSTAAQVELPGPWPGVWIRGAELVEAGAPIQVPLPDNWNRRAQGRGGVADYHLRFDWPRSEGDVGVFVPRLSRVADVMVNGIPATTIGRKETPVLPTWNEPQFFTIPALMLAEGANTVTFRLTAEPRSRAGLSAVFVGPREVTRQKYERRTFWQTSLPRFFEMLVLVVAMAITWMWFMKRNEAFIGWFAVCAWMWSVRVHQLFLPELGLTLYQSEVLSAVSVHGSQLAEVIATLRLRGLRLRRLENLMLAHFGLGAIVLLLAPADSTAALLRWIYLPLTVAAFYFNIRLGIEAWRNGNRPLFLFAALIMTAMCFGLHDFLVVAGVLAFDGIFWLRFGGPLMILALAGLLVQRYVASLKRVEKLNTELGDRIAAKTLELEDQYRRSRARELELTLLAERDRFTRDIHDGIGSRLIAARAAMLKPGVGHDDLRRVLDECLADLRLVIDSFDPHAASLDAMLGDFRAKSMPSLRAIFSDVHWPVDGLADCHWLGPKGNLAVLRSLQEMLGNAMKHGDKGHLRVGTRCDADAVELCVENGLADAVATGQGALPGLQLAHRGLASLDSRARQLGGAFAFVTPDGRARASLQAVRAGQARAPEAEAESATAP